MKSGIVIFTSFIFAIVVSNSFSSNLAGNALLFDGTNDYVRIPDAPQLDGMRAVTVETWFYPPSADRTNFLVTKSDGIDVGTDRSYEVITGSNGVYSLAFFSGTTGWTWLHTGTSLVVPNQWVHIATTYDSIKGIANLYLNGNLSITTHFQANDISPINEPIRNTQRDLILGAMFDRIGNAYGFSYGMMDEVRIWNVARSDAEIKEWYNKTVSPTTNGLVGYWNFDENTGNPSALDLSSFHDNGTLVGATRISSTAPIVPEPATVLLFGLGGMLLRRKAG
jgi:hypothetical protein